MTCRVTGCSLCPHALFSQARSHIMLTLDETKIKEDIVFDKNTGEITGFTNPSDINNAIYKKTIQLTIYLLQHISSL